MSRESIIYAMEMEVLSPEHLRHIGKPHHVHRSEKERNQGIDDRTKRLVT